MVKQMKKLALLGLVISTVFGLVGCNVMATTLIYKDSDKYIPKAKKEKILDRDVCLYNNILSFNEEKYVNLGVDEVKVMADWDFDTMDNYYHFLGYDKYEDLSELPVLLDMYKKDMAKFLTQLESKGIDHSLVLDFEFYNREELAMEDALEKIEKIKKFNKKYDGLIKNIHINPYITTHAIEFAPYYNNEVAIEGQNEKIVELLKLYKQELGDSINLSVTLDSSFYYDKEVLDELDGLVENIEIANFENNSTLAEDVNNLNNLIVENNYNFGLDILLSETLDVKNKKDAINLVNFISDNKSFAKLSLENSLLYEFISETK